MHTKNAVKASFFGKAMKKKQKNKVINGRFDVSLLLYLIAFNLRWDMICDISKNCCFDQTSNRSV